VPVLTDVFPLGVEALPSGRPQRLRRTYEEWRDAVDTDDLGLPALRTAWIDEVLVTALERDAAVLRKGATLPERLTVLMPEHGVTVAPDLAVVNPTNRSCSPELRSPGSPATTAMPRMPSRVSASQAGFRPVPHSPPFP